MRPDELEPDFETRLTALPDGTVIAATQRRGARGGFAWGEVVAFATADARAWRQLGALGDGASAQGFASARGQWFAHGSDGNVWRSDDAGRSWTQHAQGPIDELLGAPVIGALAAEDRGLWIALAGTLTLRSWGGDEQSWSIAEPRRGDRKGALAALKASVTGPRIIAIYPGEPIYVVVDRWGLGVIEGDRLVRCELQATDPRRVVRMPGLTACSTCTRLFVEDSGRWSERVRDAATLLRDVVASPWGDGLVLATDDGVELHAGGERIVRWREGSPPGDGETVSLLSDLVIVDDVVLAGFHRCQAACAGLLVTRDRVAPLRLPDPVWT